MENIEITKIQKRIFIFLGAAILAFGAFIYFIYIPANTYKNTLKEDYTATQAQINELKKSFGNDKPIEQLIESLKDRIALFDKKFPDKEEMVLREIPELAKKCGVEVSSISPSKKVNVTAINNAPVAVKDYNIQQMQIGVVLMAPYKSLGEFIRSLRDDFHIFVGIENINISKSGGVDSSSLNVSLNLTTYLLIPQKA